MKIDQILDLSCLTLDETEKKSFEKQFSQIVSFFDELNTIQTEGIEPLVTPVDIKIILREDEDYLWEDRKQALEQAPEKEGSLFRVPPVVS